MKLKKMIVVISLISLFLFDKVVLAQNIQLYPGQSIRINQDIISCQGVSPYPSSLLGCVIEKKNMTEYYLYTVDSLGKSIELSHSIFIDDVIQAFQTNRNQNGPCKLGHSACYISYAAELERYVLYSNLYGKTTSVETSEFKAHIQSLFVRLQQAGICE